MPALIRRFVSSLRFLPRFASAILAFVSVVWGLPAGHPAFAIVFFLFRNEPTTIVSLQLICDFRKANGSLYLTMQSSLQREPYHGLSPARQRKNLRSSFRSGM